MIRYILYIHTILHTYCLFWSRLLFIYRTSNHRYEYYKSVISLITELPHLAAVIDLQTSSDDSGSAVSSIIDWEPQRSVQSVSVRKRLRLPPQPPYINCIQDWRASSYPQRGRLAKHNPASVGSLHKSMTRKRCMYRSYHASYSNS